jgi:hypothetical protein
MHFVRTKDVTHFLLNLGILSSVSGLLIWILQSPKDRPYVATCIFTGLTNSVNINTLMYMVTLNTKHSVLSHYRVQSKNKYRVLG